MASRREALLSVRNGRLPRRACWGRYARIGGLPVLPPAHHLPRPAGRHDAVFLWGCRTTPAAVGWACGCAGRAAPLRLRSLGSRTVVAGGRRPRGPLRPPWSARTPRTPRPWSPHHVFRPTGAAIATSGPPCARSRQLPSSARSPDPGRAEASPSLSDRARFRPIGLGRQPAGRAGSAPARYPPAHAQRSAPSAGLVCAAAGSIVVPGPWSAPTAHCDAQGAPAPVRRRRRRVAAWYGSHGTGLVSARFQRPAGTGSAGTGSAGGRFGSASAPRYFWVSPPKPRPSVIEFARPLSPAP